MQVSPARVVAPPPRLRPCVCPLVVGFVVNVVAFARERVKLALTPHYTLPIIFAWCLHTSLYSQSRVEDVLEKTPHPVPEIVLHLMEALFSPCRDASRLNPTQPSPPFTSLFHPQASLVSVPLWRGLNGFPASREVLPGVVRLLALLVAFTFSAVRLPPLWAAHARAYRDCCLRGRRLGRSGWREREVERVAAGNMSPLSDHHNA